MSHLAGKRSPEAEVAIETFSRSERSLTGRLANCISGRELIEKGYGDDVTIAGELNTSKVVPQYLDAAYREMIGSSSG